MARKVIPNREAARYVTDRVRFRNYGNTLYGYTTSTRGETQYVVNSYGMHWPLYVYDEATSTWYGNKDKRSATTTMHSRWARPVGVEVTWVDKEALILIARDGVAAAVGEILRRAA